ncbi:yippee-domain-containing protein [Mycena metata]|uniref:Protein yippee-like n=1 Tax=Mycena metata TaxID=1033252 RepID=A0AAD7IQN8_9AGAR|nr:yippee-domain-containing protein [Mycena metata]
MSTSSDTRNQVIQAYPDHPTYNCSTCSAVIALQDETITKLFQGRDGRGLRVPFILRCSPFPQALHTVADVFCLGCNERMGWYYHKASDFSQKYKEGKYLLEREKLVKENAWELEAS